MHLCLGFLVIVDPINSDKETKTPVHVYKASGYYSTTPPTPLKLLVEQLFED